MVNSSCKKFTTQEELIEGLRLEDSRAIQCILNQVEKACMKMIKQIGLSNDKFPDILHDGLLLFIKKIQNRIYDPSQSSPNSYLIGICKYLALNASRSKKEITTLDLEERYQLISEEASDYSGVFERYKLLERLLAEMGSPCNELIRIKYIDGYPDEEQIKLKLTKYSSHESLRVSRSQCMKKLSLMATKYKSTYENL